VHVLALFAALCPYNKSTADCNNIAALDGSMRGPQAHNKLQAMYVSVKACSALAQNTEGGGGCHVTVRVL
jgi:hypothetical protein